MEIPAIISPVRPHIQIESYCNVLPRGANKGRFRIVRRIPRADTELEPSFSIDGQVDLPQPPGVIVLRSANPGLRIDQG